MSGIGGPGDIVTSNEYGYRDESKEIRTQFYTREGTYKLFPLSEYARPNRMPFNGPINTPVRASFAKTNSDDRICFNIGKELYVYPYNGIRKAADLTRPLDKRLYRGTSPTCHDFNLTTANSECILLVIGFSAGQVQLVDPISKEIGKLFNEERLIDRSKVTCIRWIPNSTNQFLVAHASGQMFLYQENILCSSCTPVYQSFKSGDGFSIFTCKTKLTKNPLYRWLFDGSPCINEFSFSPCSHYIAVVTQDGFLRVLNYDQFECIGSMKSYFGGLLCVCWSHDGRYIVTGGEDDLVTIWSFEEKRVVCRGRGHTSWVNAVSFDQYATQIDGRLDDACDLSGSDEEDESDNPSLIKRSVPAGSRPISYRSNSSHQPSSPTLKEKPTLTTYRLGSVGQDTQLCLWDLTEDILRESMSNKVWSGSGDNNLATNFTSQNNFNQNYSTTIPNSFSTSNSVNIHSLLNNLTVSSHINSSSFSNNANIISTNVTTTSINIGNINSNNISSSYKEKDTSVITQNSSQLVGSNYHSSNSNNYNNFNGNLSLPSNREGYNLTGTNSVPLTTGYNGSMSTSSLTRLDESKIGNSLEGKCYDGKNGYSGDGKINEKKHKFKGSKLLTSSNQNNIPMSSVTMAADSSKLLGTSSCPRLNQVPIIEPLTCKKIANDRLTCLTFREDCLVTVSQEGIIYTWARPKVHTLKPSL